jgi:alcohol dehydrogenase
LNDSFEIALRRPGDVAARERMLLGAHVAGAAIENSMLGAAHACANPLTAMYGIVHGAAVGAMLPHVIRFNADGSTNPYASLVSDAGELAMRVEGLLAVAGLPSALSKYGVTSSDVPALAASAARQWTARFNPRPVDEGSFRQIYESAL